MRINKKLIRSNPFILKTQILFSCNFSSYYGIGKNSIEKPGEESSRENLQALRSTSGICEEGARSARLHAQQDAQGFSVDDSSPVVAG